jgi:hypothetical protein
LAINGGVEAGNVMPGGVAVPVVAKLADEGDVAGFKPGTSTAGDGCVDGSCGCAERATADESLVAGSDFHQAHFGPD